MRLRMSISNKLRLTKQKRHLLLQSLRLNRGHVHFLWHVKS